jgi:hypothetical protein
MSKKTTAERNAIKRAKLAEAEAYVANPFDNYESISTPEGMIWREGERFPRWGLPINSPAEFRHRYQPRNP